MTTNTDTVMGVYAAFGRGDVAHILDQLADDIAWDHGIRANDLPYLQPRTGKEQVAKFFPDLAENIEFTMFEPGQPCDGGDTVMVAVREVARNLKTGAVIPEEISVHIWTFDQDGKLAKFRHVIDIAVHEAAARPVAASATSS